MYNAELMERTEILIVSIFRVLCDLCVVRRKRAVTSAAVAFALAALASGCASRTRSTAPAVETPAAFKENANWKPAQPADTAVRGKWWEVFGDAELNGLEEQIAVSNQTLKGAAAQFEQARAALRATRSALYPEIDSDPSLTRARQSGARAISSFHATYTDFLLPATASYEADVWGRVRGTIAASRAALQATAADVESVSLSLHAELATDYFTLRGLDRERQLLDSAVTAFRTALDLTQNRYRGGLASQADVALAETQLETTRAQAVDVDVARALVEHAIAVLVGRPASSFSMPRAPLTQGPPAIPVGLPTELLERRPDVAGAERRVAEAHAQAGVAAKAYYPLLTLSGAAGFESSSFGNWIAGISNFWAVGPAVAVTAFDAGRRRAAADQARAVAEQAAAGYQQTVLTAFREVEDQLATLRVLDEEARILDNAVAASERSLTLATNRYRGGVTTYLEVITAQSAALGNERAAVDILTRRMVASVLLVRGLGGGWNVSSLPAADGR
jgi:NodT family efflux transporter outer membrane factor (OMF) lipoprotein